MKKVLPFCAAAAVVLFGIFLFLKSPFFAVELIQTEIHLELGESAQTNPAAYLAGEEWCVALSRVDTSNVKKKQVGRYPIYISHGFESYVCYVNMVDTTAPKVSCSVKTKTVTPGETVSVHSLGLDIQDYSEIESVAFTRISSTHFYTGMPEEEIVEMKEAYKNGLDMYAEEFQFAYGGIYTLTITAEDSFHNRGETTITLKVEEAPVIETAADYYVAVSNQIDFTEYVTAWDFLDEDLDAADVKIDTSQLQIEKEGVYVVAFSAVDSYGLQAAAQANVHVYTQEQLQKLINTHQISVNEDVVIGAYNLYDSGYYTDADISLIQEGMLPAIVNVKNDVLETYGCGFILAIDEAFVTIATNEHVITDDISVDIAFYDGTACKGAVVAANKRKDIAFIRIPIQEKMSATALSLDYVKSLRTVHINESYWKQLSNDGKQTIGYSCIDANGKVWKSDAGTIVEKTAVRTWNEYEDINEMIISMQPVSGSSGSAIFDAYGHLLGMIRGYTDYSNYTETVAVPLNEILSYYEQVFKIKVQYQ